MTQLLNRKLEALQNNVTNIRNICILAHVDHGKTTLADSLVAANGVISARLAGKLRYMDSRKDEQERGITMKSSVISLYYPWNEQEYLVNLMDSPGHVDFSSEVCTAVRLCDGAIVVVDLVEGVQPQTKLVLQQAWDQGIKPILVLNKMDRLITEMKFDTRTAYQHISQVLEQVNAVMGEMFATKVMSGEQVTKPADEEIQLVEGETFDWRSGLDEADDSQLYFAPEQGNVIFASAADGWAFSIDTFADIYAAKLNFNKNVLRKTLWGDFYINMKEKKILRGASAKSKKPLFVQMVLDNIWAFYNAILNKEKDNIEKMVGTLNLKISARDMKSTDTKQQLHTIMSTWLPLAVAVLSMVCQQLPSPADIGVERSKNLMCPQTKNFDTLPTHTQALLDSFEACSSDENQPQIALISKMIPFSKSQMPENRAKPLTEEELAVRRAAARERHQERMLGNEGAIQLTEEQIKSLEIAEEEKVKPEKEIEFIAFARVFSGTIKPGDELFVLGPKYDPSAHGDNLSRGEFPEDCHGSKATVGNVFMLLGRDLEPIGCASAGNIVGISGLEESVIKSATVCSNPWCPPFVDLVHSTVPILRVAIEPVKSSDLSALSRGLQLLNQADAHVEVIVSEAGEFLLVTAGEVHLQRCILDLTESYAKCEVTVSDPIVPFRETIVPVPETDMLNEAIEGENVTHKEADEGDGSVDMETPNKQSRFRIRSVPLPADCLALLQKHADLLKALNDPTQLSIQSETELNKFKDELEQSLSSDEILKDSVSRIISFGPKRNGPNILVMKVEDLECGSVWPGGQSTRKGDQRSDKISSLVNGFQLATLAGPICEEPMMGVGMVVESWELDDEGDTGWGPLSGQIVSAFKEGCRRAFQAQPQRLVMAMYTCEIAVKAEVLGKMYSVIARRRGQIVQEEMVEGSSTFTVTAHIPVVESLDLANELRKQTSGLAMPQLVFTHWEVLDIDPYWEPQTEEELTHFGEKADSENPARLYMNKIKRRKGLKIDEKIVEFAEKQRTLTKSK